MTIRLFELARAHEELAGPIAGAIERVLASSSFILGAEVEQFESEFAAYCGAGHCIGVGNGLDALFLILTAMGIGAGDEVIVPATTFAGAWLGVTRTGARPVPVQLDREPSEEQLDCLAHAISSNTRAVIVVPLYGLPQSLRRLRQMLDERGVPLVEDAAQAHGALNHGERVGAASMACAFSFYPAKNLGALGDGGAITTSNDALADTLSKLRNYGCEDKYSHVIAGFNSRLDEIQAAVLRAKLVVLDDWNARRRRLAERYIGAFAHLPLGIEMPHADSQPVWHQFVIRVDDRTALRSHLQSLGIETGIHYPLACHRQPAFSAWLQPGLNFPKIDLYHEQVVSLPMGPHLLEAEQDAVIDALRSWVERQPG